MSHQPVLLSEVITHLAIKPDGIYVDGTVGRAGHAQAILTNLSEVGRLIVCDRDAAAIDHASALFGEDKRVTICRDNFTALGHIAEKLDIVGQVDGVLLDLGVSSPQLDIAERGFSFLHDGPLDMRMDQRQALTAATWINNAAENEIADAFFQYGDERYSRRIARAIVFARKKQAFTRTSELAECIKAAHPRWQRGKHPATQCFQALRIIVNDEINALNSTLIEIFRVVKVGGRVVVITFHSTEDRTVKQFIRAHSGQHQTLTDPSATMRVKRIAKVMPKMAEVKSNPRSRSAKLLVLERIV